MKDLVAMRPALCRIAEEAAEVLDHGPRAPPAETAGRALRDAGPEARVHESVESSKLAMKLEKWRADLSPDRADQDAGEGFAEAAEPNEVVDVGVASGRGGLPF